MMPRTPIILALAIVAPTVGTSSAIAVNCNGKVAQIVGTNGADLLVGTTGPDVINAQGGDDEVRAWAGNDDVCGASGDDYILGHSGNDWLDGNAGNDEVRGQSGNDSVYGGVNGSDMLYGGGGDDDLHGYVGNDELFGGGDADVLYGQGGDDVLNGGKGEDHVWGGDGHDDVFGGTGKDYIYGESGNDRLRAEPPVGSATIDYSRGGAGHDCIDLFGPNNAAWGEGGEDHFEAYARPWIDCGSALDSVNYHDVVPPDGLYGCEFVQDWPPPSTCFGSLSLTDENKTVTASEQSDGANLEIRRVRCGLENVIGANERIAPNGQFCFVSFHITNTTDTSIWLDTRCQILVDDAGIEYVPDEAATRIVMEERSLDEAIAPGETVEDAGLVYDIPNEATAASVRLHSSCGSSGFVVDLRPIGDASSWAGYSMTASEGR